MKFSSRLTFQMGVSGKVLLVCAVWYLMDQVHSVPYHINEGLSAVTPPLRGVFSECGKSKKTEMNKLSVVNGQDAILGDWPWMVGLFELSSENPKPTFLCGGSLISNQWILTAAHCNLHVKNNASRVLVRLGDLNYDDQIKDGASPIDAAVDQLVSHPKFHARPYFNDIGLVRLKNPVRFSEKIRPICLLSGQEYKTSEYYEGKESFVLGWGRITDFVFGNSTSKLQEASINVIEEEVCKKHPLIPKSFTIDEKVICAGGSGKNACKGDSGGPLMFLNDDEERFYLGGIVSGGNQFACSENPVVYTKVAQFICWINEVTNEDF